MFDFLAKSPLQGLTKGPGGCETDSRVVEAGLAAALVLLAAGTAKAMSDGHVKVNVQTPQQPHQQPHQPPKTW